MPPAGVLQDHYVAMASKSRGDRDHRRVGFIVGRSVQQHGQPFGHGDAGFGGPVNVRCQQDAVARGNHDVDLPDDRGVGGRGGRRGGRWGVAGRRFGIGGLGLRAKRRECEEEQC